MFGDTMRAAMEAERQRILQQMRDQGASWRLPLQGWLRTAGGPPRDGDLQIAKGTTLVWSDGAWRPL